MLKKYSKEELWKIYWQLPKELQDAIFSKETTETIENIGKRYELSEEEIGKLAEMVGYSLLGLLPPEDFEGELISEIKLSLEKAKKITNEITRYIFFPLKDFLETIYLKKTEPEKKPIQRDIYREPIE